jgi:hypothetical protein
MADRNRTAARNPRQKLKLLPDRTNHFGQGTGSQSRFRAAGADVLVHLRFAQKKDGWQALALPPVSPGRQVNPQKPVCPPYLVLLLPAAVSAR